MVLNFGLLPAGIYCIQTIDSNYAKLKKVNGIYLFDKKNRWHLINDFFYCCNF
jgi:hypothetical protein